MFLHNNDQEEIAMSNSILAVAFLGVLVGCASTPNVEVMHAPGSYFQETANPIGTHNRNSSITSLGVVYKF